MTSWLDGDGAPRKRLYRAFLIGPDGRTDRFEVVEAASETSAITYALALADERWTVELWDRARKIATIPKRGDQGCRLPGGEAGDGG